MAGCRLLVLLSADAQTGDCFLATYPTARDPKPPFDDFKSAQSAQAWVKRKRTFAEPR